MQLKQLIIQGGCIILNWFTSEMWKPLLGLYFAGPHPLMNFTWRTYSNVTQYRYKLSSGQPNYNSSYTATLLTVFPPQTHLGMGRANQISLKILQGSTATTLAGHSYEWIFWWCWMLKWLSQSLLLVIYSILIWSLCSFDIFWAGFSI